MKVSARFQQRILASAMIVSLAIAGPVFSGTATAAAPIQQNHQTTSPQHWLQQAREMMDEGRVELAEQYVQLAETLIQRQPGLKLDYTPEMARQRIAEIRTGGQPQVAPVVQQTIPKQTQAAPAAAPATPKVAVEVPAAPLQQDIATATAALLKARQAVAVGDVQSASALADQARKAASDFSSIGDSPELIDQLIDQQNQLSAMRSEANPNYNRGAATFLLYQANALLKYQDIKTSKTLIQQAQQFNVTFTPEVGNPDQLLAVIETLEAQSGQPAVAQDTSQKQEVLRLLSQAQFAIDQERWEDAVGLVGKAKAFDVADAEFSDTDVRPWQLELKIQNALKQGNNNSFAAADEGVVAQAAFSPESDTTKVVQTAAIESSFGDRGVVQGPRGMNLFQSGAAALNAGDYSRATEYFKLASQYPSELSATAKLTIDSHLKSNARISDSNVIPAQSISEVPGTMDLDNVRNAQQAEFRKIQSAIYKERAAAEKLLETDPNGALEKLTMIRSRVESATLSQDTRRPLLTLIDRDITEIQAYIEENLPEIINDEQNQANRDLIERRAQRRLDTENQLAALVKEYNDMIDERRFDEAGAIAQQAMDLAPDTEIAAVMQEKYRAESNLAEARRIKALKEQGVVHALNNADEAAIPFDEYGSPLIFNNHEEYLAKMKIRQEKLEGGRYESDAERKIWNVLENTEVQGEYRGSLNVAVRQLAGQAGVNIVFDAIALNGVSTDQQIDVPLTQPIKLKSALKIILQNAGLVYAVEDGVIKVTTPESRRANLQTDTYYIGDLVMPMNAQRNPMEMIWNNNPYQNKGLGYGGGVMNVNGNAPQTVSNGPTNAIALAQQLGGGGNNPFNGQGGLGNPTYGGPAYGSPAFGSVGGSSLGGVSLQDFTPLIELIQSTVSTDTWADTGQGEGTIQAYPANLSLVVSNTQEVQDQIVDLLKKLRELNDVQIVIEVRFITLSDDFFERVGVDFDFALNDNAPANFNPGADVQPQSQTIGFDTLGPTGNFDLQFLQDSFSSAAPDVGFAGFDPAGAASFGFAILSDIEVFLLIQAAKGNERSNILQSPTVTMFNGQSASVNDSFQRPFVTSVTPVVGDFAVAHQPVITILPDGTNLNVSAVVSNDRRSVRMTLVPQFTQIGEVETFTFSGSTVTEVSTNSLLDDLLDLAVPDAGDDELQTSTQGVTIQLPVIATTSVSTVVSVPDGGTILLGGIKRMTELRSERGVPFLSNVPYINRLFKNVSIGRESMNLMMMVTPRIIIQAEEEAAQIGETSN